MRFELPKPDENSCPDQPSKHLKALAEHPESAGTAATLLVGNAALAAMNLLGAWLKRGKTDDRKADYEILMETTSMFIGLPLDVRLYMGTVFGMVADCAVEAGMAKLPSMLKQTPREADDVDFKEMVGAVRGMVRERRKLLATGLPIPDHMVREMSYLLGQGMLELGWTHPDIKDVQRMSAEHRKDLAAVGEVFLVVVAMMSASGPVNGDLHSPADEALGLVGHMPNTLGRQAGSDDDGESWKGPEWTPPAL